MSGRSEKPAPGWYPDGTGVERWWDGEAWSEDTHEIEPVHSAEREPEPYVEAAKSVDKRWSPGDYITGGIIGVILFGLPGITRATGYGWVDVLLTIGGAVAGVWLLIGIISLAVRAGHRD